MDSVTPNDLPDHRGPMKSQPVISVLMANYNGAPYLRQAITSVLTQTFAAFELILVDDGSTDGSVAIANEIAATDARLHVFSGKRFGGPAPVRNFALDQARGDWVAVVDSDDLIHPERFERMLQGVEGVDILIDDLLIFQNDGGDVQTMFRGNLAERPGRVSEEAYIRANFLYGKGSALGYAKPMIRRQTLLDGNIRYNETMRIGEDYDLVVRLLATGAVMATLPDLLYFYRKHGESISHRLDKTALSALEVAAENAVLSAAQRPAVASAHRDRLKSIRKAIGFDRLIAALKQKNLGQFAGEVVRSPSSAALLRLPVIARLKALLPRKTVTAPDVAVIIRQRIIGATNGSSTYLLALCRYLKATGRKVGLYWPTPYTFGRWPVLKLKPEVLAYDDLQWRGGLRMGRYVFATNPSVYWSLALTAVEAVLLKLKIIKKKFVPHAPSALMAPYQRADLLFLARQLKGAKALIADYAFNTPYLPYALSPDAPTMVVMHDLFSSRNDQFKDKVIKDFYGQLEFDEEMRLLGAANVVIAIQKQEASVIDAQLTHQKAIVAPMANDPVSEFGPGDSNTVLFVGSNAAPNVLGMQWFFDDIWPLILKARPQTQLKVAGTVGWSLPVVPANVKMLGLVGDLGPLYREAGVMISPLTTGSGLKIKMIEALSRAKAAVVTPLTLQGIADVVGDAVVQADDAQGFADAVIALLDNPERRMHLAQRSVDVVRKSFSSEVCFRGVSDFIA